MDTTASDPIDRIPWGSSVDLDTIGKYVRNPLLKRDEWIFLACLLKGRRRLWIDFKL